MLSINTSILYFLSSLTDVTLLGWHAHHMFDHISNAVKNIVIVIFGLPHEGGGADHFVLLIHVGLVRQEVKDKAWLRVENSISNMIWTLTKGYIWLSDVVACAHALHSLHHVCVRPVPPAGIVIPLVAHGHLDARKHAACQHWGHAGQSATEQTVRDINRLIKTDPAG